MPNMTFEEIQNLVARGESASLEFKESTSVVERACHTLCALLNAEGGHVVIGVKPSGKVVGQHVSDATLRHIASLLKRLEPPVAIPIERIAVPGTDRELIVLTAETNPDDKPYTYLSRPYEKVGSTTQVMPRHRFIRMAYCRPADKHMRWENQPAIELTVEDLDHAEILRTVPGGDRDDGKKPNVYSVLERLELLKDGKPVNAAVVLFGRKMWPNYGHCEIRMARFKGLNKSEFLDHPPPVQANAFKLLDAAESFLARHLPMTARIVPYQRERIEELLLPPRALREALANAICHRDYTQRGGAIFLAIYDDRVEITNIGTLPPGWTADRLLSDHPSIPGNELIANAFRVRNIVERWGRGTQDMVDWCRQAGHPPPEFVEDLDHVKVRFVPTVPITPAAVVSSEFSGLSIRQQRIMQCLGTGPASLQGLVRALRNEVSDAIRDDLQRLRLRGYVRRDGFGRGAQWQKVQ